MGVKSQGPLAASEPKKPSLGTVSQAPRQVDNSVAQEVLKKRMGGGTWKVQRGDTLWGISSRQYGNGALWEAIRDANPDRVQAGGEVVYVGTVLDVPEIDVTEGTSGGVGGTSRLGGRAAALLPEYRSTDFGDFETYPDDFIGPLPASHDAVQVVYRSRFTELEKAAATQTVDPEVAALEAATTFLEPVVVTIAGEQVRVSSKAEATHAVQMFREIKQVYGIKVDSQAGVDAIKAQYAKVPGSELDKLMTKEWEYKEVLALHSALSHFAPILGAQRATSSRADAGQEIKSVSKVDQAIDENSATGVLDSVTLGEYFKGTENFSMFSKGTNSTVDFKDNQKQLEGTAIHEIAHGLMRDEVDSYASATGYWTDRHTKSGAVGAEEPVTPYGRKNASEDLSEAVMYYFVEPRTLQTKCPTRSAYIEKTVSNWPKAP